MLEEFPTAAAMAAPFVTTGERSVAALEHPSQRQTGASCRKSPCPPSETRAVYRKEFRTLPGLRKLCAGPNVWDYTFSAQRNPALFAAKDVEPPGLSSVRQAILRILQPVVPTYIWIATKGELEPSGQTSRIHPHLSCIIDFVGPAHADPGSESVESGAGVESGDALLPAWRRADFGVRVAILGGTIAFAWVGSGFEAFSQTALLAVLLPVLLVAGVAMVQPRRPGSLTPHARLALGWWGALLLAGLLWEAYAFMCQPTLTTPSFDHPTLSVMLDPVLEYRAARCAGWFIWLQVGRHLLTTWGSR